LTYKIGDKVEVKDYGRRRRARWVAAKVYDRRIGAYGEITYTVKFRDSGRKEKHVPGTEMRFRDKRDSERRMLDDKIANCIEDSKQIHLKFARLQRGELMSGRRSMSECGVRYHQREHRSLSEDGRTRMIHHRREPRAESVPPRYLGKAKEIFLNIILPQEETKRNADNQEAGN